MARADLEEYRLRYTSFSTLTRRDGILEVRFHDEKGSAARFNRDIHNGLPSLWLDIGGDPQNRVIIVTGTDGFLFELPTLRKRSTFVPMTPDLYAPLLAETWKLVWNLVDVEVPVIAALNGAVPTHTELTLMCDLVVAAPETYFSDPFHYRNGIVPGDGVHAIWPTMMGLSRSRHFLMDGYELPSSEAKRLGLVHEIVAREEVLPRAWELARSLTLLSDVTLRSTRLLFTHMLKVALVEQLPLGAALEGLGSINHWPVADD
jgi:enoyl-CoA hydratase/carnithine racemase